MNDYEKVIKYLANAKTIGTGTLLYKGKAYRIDYNYNPPKIKKLGGEE